MDFQELGWDFYFKIKYLPFIQFIFLKLRLTFCHIVRKNTRTICAKRFPVLLQMISQSPENDFRTYWHPSYGLCHAENRIRKKHGQPWEGFTLLYLPQTVFRPKRFASFRPPLYQRFKVNFLPHNLSPRFHRKTSCPHETVFNKFVAALVFNTLRWRTWQGLFHVVYL